jgi:hypothetical protein
VPPPAGPARATGSAIRALASVRSAPDPTKYGYGPERLVIGRYCAIASKVRFLMSGGNHADLGPSTFPFGIFGEPWAERTMDLVMSAPTRGDTVVGQMSGSARARW